jgi:uncharacterized iron-regulated membrane protein
MLWLHTWAGLVLGWLLFAIWLAGSICVFWWEIDYWGTPERHAVPVAERSVLLQSAEAYLQKTAPNAKRWIISLPNPDGRDSVLRLATGSILAPSAQFLPDGSGRKITTHTLGGRFFVDFHWTLNNSPLGPGANPITFFLVGVAGAAFCWMCITGVVVHKRIFKDFFTWRPEAGRQRRWLDFHNVLGVLPLPFHFLIALTGVSFFCFAYLPSAVSTIYKADSASFQGQLVSRYKPAAPDTRPSTPARMAPIMPLIDRAEAEFGKGLAQSITITNPGRANAIVQIGRGREGGINVFNLPSVVFDGVSGRMIRGVAPRSKTLLGWDFFTSLHFAFFGGAFLRWLYLICGLAGAATIASGLVMFTIKREQKHGEAGLGSFRWFADRMNIAAVAGPMMASVSYLWAVRLLPAAMAHRTDWEVRSFYLVWLVSLVHAFLRKPARGWTEQLVLTAALCLGLPVLGFFTPNSSLVFSFTHGDVVTAGVDLFTAAVGVGLLAAARYGGRITALRPRRTAAAAGGAVPEAA